MSLPVWNPKPLTRTLNNGILFCYYYYDYYYYYYYYYCCYDYYYCCYCYYYYYYNYYCYHYFCISLVTTIITIATPVVGELGEFWTERRCLRHRGLVTSDFQSCGVGSKLSPVFRV